MVQHLISLAVGGDAVTAMFPMHRSLAVSASLRHEIPPAYQVVRGGAERKLPIDEASAAMPQFAEQRDRLQPAEGLLNELPFLMTAPIPGMSSRPRVDRAAAVSECVLGHVRRDAQASDGRDPGARVVRFVGTDGEAPRRQRQ